MPNAPIQPFDPDYNETQEWLDALESVIALEGPDRAQFLVQQLLQHLAYSPKGGAYNTPYQNTISPDLEAEKPGDEAIEQHLSNLIRWNALAMVLRAGKKDSNLGGHIASYASSATLYEVGFNYFFRARNDAHLEDLIYFQGHVTPGIYARAFLEGRLTERQLEHFRQEVGGEGLSSYPHPHLMPTFWQFPTVSMGLGPLQALYQARFLKYLENRGLLNNRDRKVWAFLGDGEMDEPESLGAITLGGREHLDNLIFVVNCNLQRLDGPVRGNGKIVQELENLFIGAGWRVIKVLWSEGWDALFAKDTSGLLLTRMQECVDGDFQAYATREGAYMRTHFFGRYPELLALVSDMTDEQLKNLTRGGHSPQKVYAAYAEAVKTQHQPTLILAKTLKGFGMGPIGEAKNTTHQQKKMPIEALETFCERFNIPIPKDQIAHIPFCSLNKKDPEYQYLKERRRDLGGDLPKRYEGTKRLPTPPLSAFEPLLISSLEREFSTTMAFVRILGILLKDKNLGTYVVPIVADESRTFGMEGLFRQIGIYSPHGQLYEPEDKAQVMYYREDKKGQLLQEGISEAGAFCSWMAAGTSYSANDLPMIPFYIYYSMFGFQRIGDLAWAAADMQTRGFLLGATAGRTTLAGEGLQHTDGHSLVFSSVIPNCISYDPTYAYELAVIIREGLRRMFEVGENVYYYITLMNENYPHPEMPKGVEAGIIQGMYLLKKAENKKAKLKVRLLGSGTILREVEKAAALLQEYHVDSEIWSVTSFTELRRNSLSIEEENRLNPFAKPKLSYVAECLSSDPTPVIAATDYMKIHADQIRSEISAPYYTLGTDGFGCSDSRVHLREYFQVNARHIAYTALKALFDQGLFSENMLKAAIEQLHVTEKRGLKK